MTLHELSDTYAASAEALHRRIVLLRAQLCQETDAEAAHSLSRRIAELEPLLRETRALWMLTAHYYDRGYHKNESYCF